MRHVFRILLHYAAVATLAMAPAACKPADKPVASATASASPHEARAGVEHRFAIAVDDVAVQMRLAILPHEQQRGLMYVKSMPEDEGMLFVYESGRQVSFWMRNTFIPLDIGYFDETGKLLEVYPMYPHVEDPVVSASGNIRYCLEMNQGWFGRHGIRPGARLDLEALGAAIAQRGFEPERYVDIR